MYMGRVKQLASQVLTEMIDCFRRKYWYMEWLAALIYLGFCEGRGEHQRRKHNLMAKVHF